MKNRKGALGRNILLDTLGKSAEVSLSQPSDGLILVGVHEIDRSPWQPRIVFQQDALNELAHSLTTYGVMQPLVVRRVNHRFELIAGERRWRAAQIAGLKQVPVLIQAVDDRVAATLALVENLQREDLNPLEQGQALVKLRQAFGLDQQALAELVGLSRPQVSNLMRLDQLDSQVKAWLGDAKIDMGHARALLGAPADQQRALGAKVIASGLNVRQTESLIAGLNRPKPSKTAPSEQVTALQQRFADLVGAPVSIQQSPKGNGKITINYKDLSDLTALVERLKSGNRS